MKGILIKTLRIDGFRGLNDFEIDFEPTTVLTGENNVGKTTILKSLQLLFGRSSFLSKEDFNIEKLNNGITIDCLILPYDYESNSVLEQFPKDWAELFTLVRTGLDENDNQFLAFRVSFDFEDGIVKRSPIYILMEWPDKSNWLEIESDIEQPLKSEWIPYFYMDAQRDIVEDIKNKTSYLGKLVSGIEYDSDIKKEIEQKLNDLNSKAVENSDTLKEVAKNLKELEASLAKKDAEVSLTPFAKELRDINKTLSIHYDNFTMDYHGMGTRSWSSFLVLKAFVQIKHSLTQNRTSHPIFAFEEPEAHLHPNAQKKLYSQISTMPGQKIIATHSPNIAASAELEEIRSITKAGNSAYVGKIDVEALDDEGKRKIKREVIRTYGELFFSKMIVTVEGETEEQAIPVFAERELEQHPSHIGVDIIGVGGGGKKHKPFISLANDLNIPWLIFSDGEKNEVKKLYEGLSELFASTYNSEAGHEQVIVIGENQNFESYFVFNSSEDDIKLVLDTLNGSGYANRKINENKNNPNKNGHFHRFGKAKYEDLSETEKDQWALIKVLTSQKTVFGDAIARHFIEQNIDTPLIFKSLFKKIKEKIS